MEKDIDKYSNNEVNLNANQQLLGLKELFRVVVFKEWVTTPRERIDFAQRNKALIRKE